MEKLTLQQNNFLNYFKVDLSINFGNKQNRSMFANCKWVGHEAGNPTAQAI